MKLNKEILTRIAIGFFVSFVLLIILTYKYHFYFAVLRLITPRTKKAENNEQIKNLHPTFAIKVGRFIKDLERQGADVTITSGYRSFEKQQELFSSGQTPAKPGSSYHNYGQAVDINVNGLKMSSSYENWLPIAETIKNKYGLRWGGDFANNWDKVHYDNGNKYKIEQLQNLYNNNQLVSNKFVKIF
jgi:peptidoglycan L-alanyl-D-glutamate endopeptidase CwlK